MKNILIKVIKRKEDGDNADAISEKVRPANPPTVTATVNDWIAENRQNKLDSDISSRKTIADWTAAADF